MKAKNMEAMFEWVARISVPLLTFRVKKIVLLNASSPEEE